jgi:hypothetical protein
MSKHVKLNRNYKLLNAGESCELSDAEAGVLIASGGATECAVPEGKPRSPDAPAETETVPRAVADQLASELSEIQKDHAELFDAHEQLKSEHAQLTAEGVDVTLDPATDAVMVAKVKLFKKENLNAELKDDGPTALNFGAMADVEGSNKNWSKFTPTMSVNMTVDNPGPAAKLAQDAEYYVFFVPVKK